MKKYILGFPFFLGFPCRKPISITRLNTYLACRASMSFVLLEKLVKNVFGLGLEQYLSNKKHQLDDKVMLKIYPDIQIHATKEQNKSENMVQIFEWESKVENGYRLID